MGIEQYNPPRSGNSLYGGPINMYAGGNALAGSSGADRESALAFYRKGLNGPFDDKAKQSLVNKQAGMAATAEGIQQEQLRNSASARGMAFSDPGFQAESRGLTANRQASTIDAAGDINRQATLANFQGGMQSADRLYGSSQGQQNSLAFSKPRVSAYGGIDFKPIKQGWAFSP